MSCTASAMGTGLAAGLGFRRRLGRLAVIAAFVIAGGLSAHQAHAEEYRLRIATGLTDGSYHRVGGELAASITRNGLGLIDVETVKSAGSIENVRMLIENKAEIALIQSDVLFHTAMGESFKGSSVKIRAIGAIMPEVIHIVVRKDAKIKSIRDLASERVAAGPPGSGTASSFLDLLEAFNVEPIGMERRYLSDEQAARAIVAGDIEAWISTTAAPNPRIARVLRESSEVELLALDAKDLREIAQTTAYLREGTIPAIAYGLKESIPAAVVRTIVVARTDLPAVLASEILHVLHRQGSLLANAHPAAGQYTLEEVGADLPLAMHDGAIAYFQANNTIKLPIEVAVGTFVIALSNLDLKSSTFEADFYIWFRWEGQYVVPGDDGFSFELTNGTIVQRDEPVIERFGSVNYVTYRVKAELRGNFLLHSYPFDRQLLEIRVESPNHTNDELTFVRDDRPSQVKDLRERSLDDGIQISDWMIEGVEEEVVDKKYKTDFGSPIDEAAEQNTYSRYVFRVKLRRHILPYVVKSILPLIVIVLMSFCVFFIHAKEFEVQAGIVITALLSCVAFHMSQVDALPEVGYLVTADKFFLLSYIVIFLTLIEVVLENTYFHRGQLDKALRLDKYARVLFPVAFFGPMGYLLIMSIT